MPTAAVILAGWSAHFTVLALGGSFWRGVLWADRAAILGEVYFCWQLRMLMNRDQWIGAAILLVFLAVFHYVAHRHALGWIIDSHGERQKVDHWIRGTPVYKPSSRLQRIAEEGEERNRRRWAILGYGVVGLPLAWCAHHFYEPSNWLWPGALGVLAAPFVLLLLVELGGEALYLVGYQDLPKGSKVLDPEPQRPGAATIAAQKVHGAASAADEGEALGLLRGGG